VSRIDNYRRLRLQCAVPVDLWKDRPPPEDSTPTPRRSTAALRILYLEEQPDLVAELIGELRQHKFWEVAHAENAQEARIIARKQPLDVALLSATMPETDPIEIAEELTQLYPKLTTFILAPDAETGGGLAYASGRFQWLPKPCNPAALVAAVERMANLVSWLTNNTTLEMVSGLHTLPSIPSNYQGVIRTIHSPHSSFQEIGEAVNKDMGMTSRVLQVANSAYYGYSKKITSPTEAALLLGIETLKSLVRYTHVLNNFPQTPATNAIFDKIWRHSNGVAAVARKIALAQTQNETLAEEAFTAGLLHDIGKLVLASMRPDDYKEVMRRAAEEKKAVHLLERVKLGTTHAETGAYLLSLWGIPFSILEAVAWHHFPSESKEKKFSALTAVHVANVAEHRRTDPENVRAAPPLDERYLADLGLAKEAEEWLKLAPDQPKREGLPQQPYVVKPATPSEQPQGGAGGDSPWWFWPAIIGGGVIILWLLFSSIFSH
jgi:HD-like signal output (HDOD) protein/CheY-like chemotaxis protein